MEAEMLKASKSLDNDTEMTYSVSSKKKPFAQLHTHDFYEITIVTQGSITHHINGEAHVVPANSLISLRPQDVHSLNGVSDGDFEYINIAFSQRTLRALGEYLGDEPRMDNFRTSPMPPTVRVPSAEILNVKRSIETLSLFPIERVQGKRAYMRFLVASLFFLYFQSMSDEKKVRPQWLDELVRKMSEPENFSKGVSRFETLSGKSLSYISRVLRERLQKTPTDFVNDVRLNYCANRLVHSDAEIIEIAMDAGFGNLSHFYHLFKARYGCSPNRYRKENFAPF